MLVSCLDRVSAVVTRALRACGRSDGPASGHKREMRMIKLLTAASFLAALFASPVIAKSPAPKVLQPQRALDKSAAQPQIVVRDGRVIGQDPDPNVRLQILREHGG